MTEQVNSQPKSLLRPCIECGELSDQANCATHRPPTAQRRPWRSAGYDAAWDRLSRRARRIQPWCSDCGTTDNLTADHTAEAWDRKARGLPITLELIDVVCRPCNSRRRFTRGDRNTWGAGVDKSPKRPLTKADVRLLSTSSESELED